MGRKNSNRRIKSFWGEIEGLSVIEMIVVLAVLAVLLILGMMQLKPLAQLAKARDSRRTTDLREISSALEDYINDHPCYPEETLFSLCGAETLKPYLKKIPCDPETRLPYVYERPECGKFIIYASLTTKNIGWSYNNKGNYVATSPNLRLEPQIGEGAAPGDGGGDGGVPGGDNYYGCFSGVCQKLQQGQDCQPKYLNDAGCWNQCGSPQNPLNECI